MSLRPTWVAPLAVLCAFATPAPAAQAQLAAGTTACTNGSALTRMNPDAIACSGSWSGNNVNQLAGSLARLDADFHAFVGAGSWAYVGTTNAGSASGPFGTVPGSIAGTLNFDNPITGFFAVALKSSTNFSFYLFDGGTLGLASIDFSTIGTSLNRRGIAQNLSHASLYDFDAAAPVPPAHPPANEPPPSGDSPGNPPPAEEAAAVVATPEPGTLLLTLSGLGALAVMVKRRRA